MATVLVHHNTPYLERSAHDISMERESDAVNRLAPAEPADLQVVTNLHRRLGGAKTLECPHAPEPSSTPASCADPAGDGMATPRPEPTGMLLDMSPLARGQGGGGNREETGLLHEEETLFFLHELQSTNFKRVSTLFAQLSDKRPCRINTKSKHQTSLIISLSPPPRTISERVSPPAHHQKPPSSGKLLGGGIQRSLLVRQRSNPAWRLVAPPSPCRIIVYWN